MDPSPDDQETQQQESQESSRSLLEATTLQINENRMASITARYRVIYGDALQDDMIASKNNTSSFTSSGHTARQMAILKCYSRFSSVMSSKLKIVMVQ